MNTPATINPLAAQQGAKQTANQMNASTPEVPFNQVLSREISGRAQPQKAEPPRNNKATTSTAESPPKAAGKSTEKEKTRKETDTTDVTATDAAAPVPNMPSDLLALVGDLKQLGVAHSTADTADIDAAAGASTVDINSAATADPMLAANLAQMASAANPADSDAAAIELDIHNAGKRRSTADLLDGQLQVNDRNATSAAANGSKGDFALTMQQATGTGQASAAVASDSIPDLAASEAGSTGIADIATGIAGNGTLQQAAMNAAQAGHNLDRLAPKVGTPAWDNALSQKVVWMVAGAEQSASLTLNPPDLGPLQVVLNVSNSQATANFIAAQPEVRQALEAAMPKLREMLEDAGIQLGQATVSTGTPGQNNDSGDASRGNRNAAGSSSEGDDTVIAPARNRTISSSGQGLVDTFA